MFTKLTEPTKGLIFFALAFALTLVAALLAPVFGEATMFLHMFTPTVATLLMLLVVTRDGYSRSNWRELDLGRAGLRSWPLATLGSSIAIGAVYSLTWGSGVGRLVLPAGTTPGGFALDFLIEVVINSLFALGEELGFRAYLLPRLLPLGTTRALLLSGLMHGLWHFPLMLLTPLYPIAGSWLIVGPLVLLVLTTAGVFYGYLRLTSASVWPSTLAHGSVNATLDVCGTLTVAASPVLLQYLAGETGILTLAATTLLAVWLIARLRQRGNIAAMQAQVAA